MRPQHITAENGSALCERAHGRRAFNEAAAYHCGKRGPCPSPSSWRRAFNEAAAYHCGKPRRPVRHDGSPAPPSMRPQHITAENESLLRRARRDRSPSMRPQHITAENPDPHGAGAGGGDDPSMRPQHITAENPQRLSLHVRLEVPSMRPQHITAENSSTCPGWCRPRRPFNEAAAYHCGKLATARLTANRAAGLQ